MSSATARTSSGGADLVVSLTEYREARHAAEFLRGTFHEPVPWLRDVTVEVAEDGAVHIVILLVWQTELLARCLPTAVNGIPVVQRVMG